MDYKFYAGQRVRHADGRSGEVTACVPGNGTTRWYYVKWDNGPNGSPVGTQLEEAHLERELKADWTPPGARPRPA